MYKFIITITIIFTYISVRSQTSCNTSSFVCTNTTQLSVGTGSIVNTNSSYPSIYGHYYKNARHQLLFTVSELNALGLVSGEISSLSFIINSIPVGYIGVIPGLTIKLKCTTKDSLTSVCDSTGLVQVYTVTNYTPVVGINTHSFSSNYIWDGTSNLLVDVCYYLNTNVLYSSNPIMPSTTTSRVKCIYDRSDYTGLCDTTTSFVTESHQRPNIKLNYCNTVTNIHKQYFSDSYMIYPNPSNDVINIEPKENSIIKNSSISLFNSVGQLIKTITINNTNKIVLDVSDYPSGFYYLSLQSSNGSSTFKIMRE